MKNLRWVFFFGVALILLLTFQAQAQEVAQTAVPGLFSQIGDWVKGNFLSLGVGVGFGLIPTVIRLSIKAIARKGAVFFTELSHFAGDTATLCDIVDKAIKEDASIDQSSIKEVIDAGKQVVVEMKDMKAVFTPKPAV